MLSEEVNALAAKSGDISPDEQEVIENFNERIAKLYGAEESDVEKKADLEKTVEEMSGKLYLIPKWVNARRLLDSVSLTAGEAGFRARLASVKEYLLEVGASEETAAAARDPERFPGRRQLGVGDRPYGQAGRAGRGGGHPSEQPRPTGHSLRVGTEEGRR